MKYLKTLYVQVIIGIIAGIIVGYSFPSFAPTAKLISDTFINMIKMVIARVIFFTVVAGIAGAGDLKKVGRVGGKAILWFVTASLASLLIGLVLVNYFQPGKYIDLTQRDVQGLNDLMTKQKTFSLQNFVEHVIPKSFIEAMANNEILQLVIAAKTTRKLPRPSSSVKRASSCTLIISTQGLAYAHVSW